MLRSGHKPNMSGATFSCDMFHLMNKNFIWKLAFRPHPTPPPPAVMWMTKSHLVAGPGRRMALPGCWCASSRSHRRDPAGSHTERSPHQTYSSLQRQTQQDLNHLRPWMVTNWTNQFQFIWMQHEFPSDQSAVKLSDSFLCVVFLCGPVSQLINKPPGVWAPTVITQGQSGSPLTQPSGAFSWSSEPITKAWGQPCVSWPPVASLKQEVTLIQRDATCPCRRTDIIDLQWYVAWTGNIADRKSMPATASYLIHWPTSDARLVLIKWLGEIWLRKATVPSDSSHW